MLRVLAPGGYLVLGEREMLPGSQVNTQYLKPLPDCPSIYQKQEANEASTGGGAAKCPSFASMRGLPAIVGYTTLEQYYAEALPTKSLQTLLGRAMPWELEQKVCTFILGTLLGTLFGTLFGAQLGSTA